VADPGNQPCLLEQADGASLVDVHDDGIGGVTTYDE
jgi:hypothetical protein